MFLFLLRNIHKFRGICNDWTTGCDMKPYQTQQFTIQFWTDNTYNTYHIIVKSYAHIGNTYVKVYAVLLCPTWDTNSD